MDRASAFSLRIRFTLIHLPFPLAYHPPPYIPSATFPELSGDSSLTPPSHTTYLIKIFPSFKQVCAIWSTNVSHYPPLSQYPLLLPLTVTFASTSPTPSSSQHQSLSLSIISSFTYTSSDVIYCIFSSLCPSLYIGQTGHHFADRFAEHVEDIRFSNDNSVSHCRSLAIKYACVRIVFAQKSSGRPPSP